MKHIGIITSGGDCGGLNGVIKGAALLALSKGMTSYIIPNGYAGLYNLVDIKSLTKLTPERIEAIDVFLAGSEAGNSRVKVSKIKDEKNKDYLNWKILTCKDFLPWSVELIEEFKEQWDWSVLSGQGWRAIGGRRRTARLLQRHWPAVGQPPLPLGGLHRRQLRLVGAAYPYEPRPGRHRAY